MQFTFRPMNDQAAQAISHWKYDDPYSFYNMENDPDDLAELLEPQNWLGRFYEAVDESKDLIGFLELMHKAPVVELGLGLRPDQTGKGLGYDFLLAALHFATQYFAPTLFRLRVAVFNQRAIHVYTKVGFQVVETVRQKTNGGEHEFLCMTRSAFRAKGSPNDTLVKHE